MSAKFRLIFSYTILVPKMHLKPQPDFNRPVISDMFLFVAFSISLCLSQARKVHFVCLSGWEWIAVFDGFWISLMLSCHALLQCGVCCCESEGCRNSGQAGCPKQLPMRVMAHWRLLAVSHLGLPSMLGYPGHITVRPIVPWSGINNPSHYWSQQSQLSHLPNPRAF